MRSTLTLDLPDIDALFEIETDPFKRHYRSQSGIEALLHDVTVGKTAEQLTVQLKVSEQNTDGIEVSLDQAVRRYCDQEIALARKELHQIGVDGRASLLRGVAFLGLCFTLSSLFTEIDLHYSILNYIFTEGMSIAGWVALWNPFDMLLFSRSPYRRRIKALLKLRDARWVVTAAPALA